jgi:hypothetical protein
MTMVPLYTNEDNLLHLYGEGAGLTTAGDNIIRLLYFGSSTATVTNSNITVTGNGTGDAIGIMNTLGST